MREVQAFIQKSAKQPLPRGGRKKYLKTLRRTLGLQTATIFGIDSDSRVARALLAADYHMKLLGMGLMPAVPGVESYLDKVRRSGKRTKSIDVLRWWFSLGEHQVKTNAAETVYDLRGSRVQLQSENQLLTDLGENIPTAMADKLNREFAQDFTDHFLDLADKYPVYADLENIFQWAVVAHLLQSRDLARRVDWHMSGILDPAQYVPNSLPAPRQVESIVGYRVVRRGEFVAGVSGGVHIAAAKMNVKVGTLEQQPEQVSTSDQDAALEPWWWD